MNIETLPSDTLRITMSGVETMEIFGQYAAIDCNDPDIRKRLCRIIGQAIPREDFFENCNRIKIELHPAKDGGCIIDLQKQINYATKYYKKLPVILLFETSEEAIREICGLASTFQNIPKSKLYRFQAKFAVETALPANRIRTLAHRCKILQTPLERAAVSEYGTLICEDAICRISQAFGD